MSRKIKIIIVLTIISVVIIPVYFLFFYKKVFIPASSAKMIEGEIVDLDENKVLLKDSSLEFDYSNMSEKPSKTIELFIYKKVEIEGSVADLRSEKEMEEMEKEYESWQARPENEKDIFSVLLPPAWNKIKKIEFSELKAGDHVRVVYFDSNEDKMIVKIIKEFKETSDNFTKENNQEISFSAKVQEVLDNMIKVKNTSSIPGLYQEGSNIEIFTDEKTKITRLKVKKADVFREEESRFVSERQKIREVGGDFLSLKAPSRYEESIINISDLSPDADLEVNSSFDGKNFTGITIQQIIK